MKCDKQNAGAVTRGRAADQVERIIATQQTSGALIESLGRDGSGTALLTAMTPPPHDPAEIEAMRPGFDAAGTQTAGQFTRD